MRRTFAAAGLAAAVLLAACARQDVSARSTSSPATPPPKPATRPVLAPVAKPLATPVAAARTVPRGTISPAPVRVVRRAAAVPLILSASMSPATVQSGSVVSATVSTTPDVVSVTAFAGGQAIVVPRVGVGRFAGSTTVPVLPPFVHGVFPVTFRASDARGVTTQTALSVTVQ